MESGQQPGSIKQQYNRVIALDRNWRESRREEGRLRRQWKQGPQAPRQNQQGVFRQKMPQPQVWPRRHKALQWQASAEPALIEEVERTNAVIVHPNQRAGFAQCNPYTMDVDWGNKIVITMGNLDICQGTVRTEEQETELGRKEDWNMNRIIDKG